MTKLHRFYSNYLSATRGEYGSVGSSFGQQEQDLLSDGAKWIAEVQNHYNLSTITRMLSAFDTKTRRAAAWALQHHGNESQIENLGILLSDADYFTRKAADQARRAIKQRNQTSIQQQIVVQIEQCMVQGDLDQAETLATLIIDEAEARSDFYSLRAFIRFARGRVDLAATDCKKAIQLDRFAYQSFVALGQCYWHQLHNGAARECYLEAARIYPDCRPAHAGIELVAGR